METARVFSDQPRASVDVLLLTMPFGSLRTPSIGLSLLQAGLQKACVSSKILYFTILFAKRIGVDIYEAIAEGHYSSIEQVGEWAFSPALFPGQDPTPYLETVLFADEPYHWRDLATRRTELEALSRELLVVREQVSDFVDQCLAIVLRYRPKIVGFTSIFQQQLASLALAKRIKAQLPQTQILFGGANVEGIMGIELLRQFPFVDAVVSGEGDMILAEIATRLLAGKSITGIPGVSTPHTTSRMVSGGTVPNTPLVRDMDSLPYPDYDDFFAQKGELNLDFSVYLLYETSRGCWWGAKQHCTFCGLNGATLTYRSKSAERATGEFVYLAERYPGYPIAAVDNILDMTYFKTFLPVLRELDMELELFYEVKANLKKEHVQLLRQANVRVIQPGIESLSTPVLRLMRKGVRALQNIQLLKWCEEVGIEPYWNLIWGFPGEPSEEYIGMAQLVPLLTHLTPPRGGGHVRLDRFSPLFTAAEQHGLTRVRPYPCYRYIYAGVPDDSLANLAYYFTFAYQDGRDVSSYTQKVIQATSAWKRDHEQSFLSLLNTGEEVFIWDLRPIAPTLLTRLTGLERALYLACDAVQGLDALVRVAEPYTGSISPDAMRRLMQRFIDLQLMIAEEDTYLSLAVWLIEGTPKMFQYQQALAILARFQQLPEHTRVAEQSVC